MDKELLIKDVIGKILEPEGFSYIGRADGISSEFFRKVKNSKGEVVRQIVSLQDSQYHKEIYLNLTSVPGGHPDYRINSFVPECTDDGLYFKSEKEYKEAIEEYADILTKYGIPFLKKIVEPRISYYLVDEDNEKLFYEHEKLLDNILTREKIMVEQFNVEEVAEYIEKKVIEVKGKPFEEVRTFLLELSALFGAVANQFYPCYWKLNESLILSCDLEFPESLQSKDIGNRWNSIFVTHILFMEWRPKRPSRLRPKKTEGIKEKLLCKYRDCTQKKVFISDIDFTEPE